MTLVSVPVHTGPEPDSEEDHGEVFTKRWVVELILDLCGYTPDKDLGALVVVEPACGAGAFLVPIIERLLESVESFGRSIEDCSTAIQATDLLDRNVLSSRNVAVETLTRSGVPPKAAKSLSEDWVHQADFLLKPPDPGSVDFVVGNPPYVRLEAVPAARSAAYRQLCGTMGGRADIYIGFYEQGLRALRSNGYLGFICADRWMRNAYGSRLRALISTGWSAEAIINMTGVDAFEKEVDAYPAITVFRRSVQSEGPLAVNAESSFGPESGSVVSEIERTGDRSVHKTPHFSAARLPYWFSGPAGWPSGSPEALALVADLESRLPPLEDPATGTKVGIGVATGADRVFIVDEDPGVEAERLLPLATVRDIASGRVAWSGKKLVNPWSEEGLVRLEEWPRLSDYLEGHRELLAGRHTAKSGNWHKTIDRVIDGLTARPKLYIPDFKEAIFPVLDEGETYPHHNLYWVTSDRWDLRVLGGLLLSDISNLFIESYSVRMRGGYLRFQAQYLRKIRLPQASDVTAERAQMLAEAFESRDRKAATQAALPLYGIERLPG
jgi:hypothetical protein